MHLGYPLSYPDTWKITDERSTPELKPRGNLLLIFNVKRFSRSKIDNVVFFLMACRKERPLLGICIVIVVDLDSCPIGMGSALHLNDLVFVIIASNMRLGCDLATFVKVDEKSL